MNSVLSDVGFSGIDLFAIVFFFFTWVLHFYVVNHSAWKTKTITAHMRVVRKQWMLNMIRREGQPIDALIQTSLQQGVLFFASTSVLLIGGLATGLGASDRAVSVLQDLPLSTTNTSAQWELKLLLIVIIFVFAFFKFAWSYRLFNYISLMIGAAPGNEAEPDTQERYAEKLSQLHALGAMHFTTGVNSYFYALSACTWFINAWLFVATTLWVSMVLYRRAFRSKFLRIFNEWA